MGDDAHAFDGVRSVADSSPAVWVARCTCGFESGPLPKDSEAAFRRGFEVGYQRAQVEAEKVLKEGFDG